MESSDIPLFLSRTINFLEKHGVLIASASASPRLQQWWFRFCLLASHPQMLHPWSSLHMCSCGSISTSLDLCQPLSTSLNLSRPLSTSISHAGLQEEGIFRKAGSTARIKELRQRCEETLGVVDFEKEEARPHDVAALLKQFLR